MLRLALAPLNPTVGQILSNSSLVVSAAARAVAARADVLVLPELAICGYPPKDLLLAEGFVQACVQACQRIAEEVDPALTVILGTPWPQGEARAVGAAGAADESRSTPLSNALVVLRGGKVAHVYRKQLLPTYDVFDEDRYFKPGHESLIVPITLGGKPNALSPGVAHIGLTVCEDLWHGQDAGAAWRYAAVASPLGQLLTQASRQGIVLDAIVNASASPFALGKSMKQYEIVQRAAREGGVSVACVNQLGGNDELIFAGDAFAIDGRGALLGQSQRFSGEMLLVDCPVAGSSASESVSAVRSVASGQDSVAALFSALRLGIADYCRKTGFASMLLGLSGGIDSAVCAVLAAAAVADPARVLGVSMPSRYSSDGSRTDAAELAHRLGIGYRTIEIEHPFVALLDVLAPALAGTEPDVTEENLQSRARGTILMALSNKFNHLLLTTGNKSELAVGYCTLYGDMNGGLAVLSDVSKLRVYELARYMNANWQELGCLALAGPPIPESTIAKPPSAELRPNQTDQDSLPPYEVLDEIIDRYVERRQSVSSICAEAGLPRVVVQRICQMIDRAEFKRKQSPVGLKVTPVAFGSGRRVPIVQRWSSP